MKAGSILSAPTQKVNLFDELTTGGLCHPADFLIVIPRRKPLGLRLDTGEFQKDRPLISCRVL